MQYCDAGVTDHSRCWKLCHWGYTRRTKQNYLRVKSMRAVNHQLCPKTWFWLEKVGTSDGQCQNKHREVLGSRRGSLAKDLGTWLHCQPSRKIKHFEIPCTSPSQLAESKKLYESFQGWSPRGKKAVKFNLLDVGGKQVRICLQMQFLQNRMESSKSPGVGETLRGKSKLHQAIRCHVGFPRDVIGASVREIV